MLISILKRQNYYIELAFMDGEQLISIDTVIIKAQLLQLLKRLQIKYLEDLLLFIGIPQVNIRWILLRFSFQWIVKQCVQLWRQYSTRSIVINTTVLLLGEPIISISAIILTQMQATVWTITKILLIISQNITMAM